MSFCRAVSSTQVKFARGGKFRELGDKGYSSTQKQSTDLQMWLSYLDYFPSAPSFLSSLLSLPDSLIHPLNKKSIIQLSSFIQPSPRLATSAQGHHYFLHLSALRFNVFPGESDERISDGN